MSGNHSQRVAEIFTTAGQAFANLGQLTAQLESSGQNTSAKWTDQDINMLASAVQRFASDIQIISENIKTKHLNQIKGSLQKKAFNEAGLVLQQVNPQQTTPVIEQQNTAQLTTTSTKQNAEVTLNALNTTENEVDVEGLEAPTEGTLDFGSNTDVN